VSIEHQRSAAGALADAGDDVRPPGRRFLQLDAKAPRVEHIGEQLRNGIFARGAVDERGIARIDTNEGGRQGNGVTNGNPGCGVGYAHWPPPVVT
jgi:hypothetical protein